MANKDYTYEQVLNGNGSYKYEYPAVYSSGVEKMQSQLKACGYTTDVDGKFGNGTMEAVKMFQQGAVGLDDDGIAGKNTLKLLSKVYTSEYYTKYGKPIPDSEWGHETVAEGNYSDKLVLARIIYAEDTGIKDCQSAVALVIKKRTTVPSKMREGVSNKWIAVVTKDSQYGTMYRGTKNAQTPTRGSLNASDGINPLWKNAVDLAKKLVAGETIVKPTGYKIDSNGGLTNTRLTYTDQLFQIGRRKYNEWLEAGKDIRNALCFYNASSPPKSNSYNVICDLADEM